MYLYLKENLFYYQTTTTITITTTHHSTIITMKSSSQGCYKLLALTSNIMVEVTVFSLFLLELKD